VARFKLQKDVARNFTSGNGALTRNYCLTMQDVEDLAASESQYLLKAFDDPTVIADECSFVSQFWRESLAPQVDDGLGENGFAFVWWEISRKFGVFRENASVCNLFLSA
jgi:hypothetical protein